MMKRTAITSLALFAFACADVSDQQSDNATVRVPLLNCTTTELGPHPVRNICVLGWVGPFGDGSGEGTDADPIDADADLAFAGADPSLGETQVVYTVDLPGTGGDGAVKFTSPVNQDYAISVDEDVHLVVRDDMGVAIAPLFEHDIADDCTAEGAELPGPLAGTQMKKTFVYRLYGGDTFTFIFQSTTADVFRVTVDEPTDFMNVYFPDGDGDGSGVFNTDPLYSECAPPSTHASEAGDCNDSNPDVGFPGEFTLGDDIDTNQCSLEISVPVASPLDCVGTSTVTGVVTSVTPNIDIPATTAETVTLDLPPGTHTIEWTATEPSGTRIEVQTITITDEPPVFTETSREDETYTRCDFDDAEVSFPIPEVTDNCDDVTPIGEVTASTNPNVAIPTTLTVPMGSTDAFVNLPLGTHTITWTATDSSDLTATLTQVVTVRPALHATNSISVRNENSTIAGDIANSGSGTASFENATLLDGDIVSVGSVSAGHRATLGHVLSQTSIDWDDQVAEADWPTIASETIGPVTVPPALDLSTISFPTTPGQQWVNPGSPTTLSPGDYGNYTVNSGGVLTLEAGQYFFEALTIHAAGKVIATEDTVLFIKNSDHFQGPIEDGFGNLVPVFVGYSGSTLNLSHDFLGTLVAPNATVRMGTGNAMNFSGMIHAAVIDVANQSVLTCDVLACDLELCGVAGEDGEEDAPTCDDGSQNGDEEGTDCGGSFCLPCEGAGGLTASFPGSMVSDNGNWYCATLEVVNPTSSPITGWSATFQIAPFSWVFSTWGGISFSANLGSVSSSGTLNPGQSNTSAGFCTWRPWGNTTALPYAVEVSP